MKLFNKLLYLTCCLFVLLSTACEKEDPTIPNDEELITTLTFTLAPMGGGSNVVLSFKDLDGDGGNAPEITGGTLNANTTYSGSVSLLNESVNPVENIGDEVSEEKEDHQFFFQFGNGLNGNITYNDLDANNQPVGLSTTLTTGAASQGQLTIILRHEPNKSGDGVSDGKIENAGGETDIEVSFDITIQ